MMMKYTLLFLLLLSPHSLLFAEEEAVVVCTEISAYEVGKRGETFSLKECPAPQRALLEKNYQDGLAEFYELSSWEDTLNALNSEISEQERLRREIDEELDFLYVRIQDLEDLASMEKMLPSEPNLLWAKTELASQQQQRHQIEVEIHRLQMEKSQQKPW